MQSSSLILATITALFFGYAPPAFADFLSVEAEKCHQPLEDGMAIVRLISGPGFALPTDGLTLSNPEADDPGSDEPLGCPGNPARTWYFRFVPHYLTLLGNAGGLNAPYSGVFDIKVLGVPYVVEQQTWRLSWYDDIKSDRENCGVSKDGLEYCYFCREDTSRPGYCVDVEGAGTSSDGRPVERAGFLVFDPGNPTGSGNIPWSARCTSARISGGRFCDTGYEIDDGLYVAYRFGAMGVDIDDLREMDLSIREDILKMRAPEYDGEDLWAP